MLLYVHSSIAIILMGKRELIALLNLSSWCLVMVERLFLTVPWGCLRFVIVVFPDHTHLLFLKWLPRKLTLVWEVTQPGINLDLTCQHINWSNILKAIKNVTDTSVIFPINIGLIHFVYEPTSVPNVGEHFTKTLAQ